MKNERTAILVEAALCIALAAVLGQLKLWRMPNGGTISLEMLPILVFALRRGVGPGVFAGMLYGAVNLLFDPVIFHWAQVLLDYPVAHAVIGLAGLFSPAWNRMFGADVKRAVVSTLVPGVLAGATARFAAAWLSGVVFFGQYAPKGQPVGIYSLLYNASYLVPATAICLVAAIAVLPVLQRRVPPS